MVAFRVVPPRALLANLSLLVDGLTDLPPLWLLFVLSWPHLFYAFVWRRPAAFKRGPARLLGLHPVDAFARCAYLLKCVQSAAVFAWFYSVARPDYGARRWAALVAGAAGGPDPWLLAAGAALAGGQLLNAAVYKKLGTDGVYYGFKLGRPIDWVTGFPFNFVPHPQYVGSALSFWGAMQLCAADEHHEAGLAAIIAFVWILYAITSAIEQWL